MPDVYVLVPLRAFARDLERVPAKTATQIAATIDRLAGDPRPRGVESLSGWPGYYRIRVGQYRVVYVIDDEARTVILTTAGHRRDVYERFKRRMGR